MLILYICKDTYGVTIVSVIKDNDDHDEFAESSKKKYRFVEDDERKAIRHRKYWRPLQLDSRTPLVDLLLDPDEKGLTKAQLTKKRFVTYFQETRKKRAVRVVDMREKSSTDDMRARIRRFEFLDHVLQYMKAELTEDDKGTYEDKKFRAEMEMATVLSEINWYCENKVDYVEDFIELYGLERIVYPTFKSPKKYLIAEALPLLNTVIRVSPATHDYALRSNTTDQLVKILSNETIDVIRIRAINALHSQMTLYREPKQALARRGVEMFNEIMINGSLTTRLSILKVLADNVLEFVVEFERDIADEAALANRSEVDESKKGMYNETCRIVRNLLLETFELKPRNVSVVGIVVRVLGLFEEICAEFHAKDVLLHAVFDKMEKFYMQELRDKKKKKRDGSNQRQAIDGYVSLLLYLDDYKKAISGDDLLDKGADKDEL